MGHFLTQTFFYIFDLWSCCMASEKLLFIGRNHSYHHQLICWTCLLIGSNAFDEFLELGFRGRQMVNRFTKRKQGQFLSSIPKCTHWTRNEFITTALSRGIYRKIFEPSRQQKRCCFSLSSDKNISVHCHLWFWYHGNILFQFSTYQLVPSTRFHFVINRYNWQSATLYIQKENQKTLN